MNFRELKAKSGLSDRQIALLCDLVALEDAGMIDNGTMLMVEPGYDAGSMEAESPGVVTYKGVELVQAFKKSGQTIYP